MGLVETQDLEEEKNEFKAYDSALVSKKEKAQFDQRVEALGKRIETIKDDIIDLNKEFNKRNSSIVKNISKGIYDAMKQENEIHAKIGEELFAQ